MQFSSELIERVQTAKTVEELLEIAEAEHLDLNEEQAEECFLRLKQTGKLSVEELDNVSNGGCSGDTPKYQVGQTVYIEETNVSAVILEVLGKQGSVFPEFKYKVEINDIGQTFRVEKWESELMESRRKPR